MDGATCTVRYDDGDLEVGVLLAHVKLRQPPPPPKPAVELRWSAVGVRVSGGYRCFRSVVVQGADVEAQYGEDEDEEWWAATVTTAHGEGFHAGTFDVVYHADGEAELFKPAAKVRRLLPPNREASSV